MPDPVKLPEPKIVRFRPFKVRFEGGHDRQLYFSCPGSSTAGSIMLAAPQLLKMVETLVEAMTRPHTEKVEAMRQASGLYKELTGFELVADPNHIAERIEIDCHAMDSASRDRAS
jgi:hypothetical protein